MTGINPQQLLYLFVYDKKEKNQYIFSKKFDIYLKQC